MAEDKKQTVILEFEVDVDQSVTSINKLTAANKELRKERNELNIASKEGQKRAAELNAQIDKNTAAIKGNVSAIEKQKINIGNYKSALDGVSPQLSKMISGIEGSTKAAWAFIATPIGAVIGALGLAVAAVTAYFKGSEEGQDRLTKITTTLSVVMNKLMLIVEDVGEALFNSSGAFDTFTKKFGIFGIALDASLAPLKLLIMGLEKLSEVTGFDKVVEDAVKAGAAIADLNDKIEENENELIVRREETNAKVQKLREDSIKQEGKLKAATIAEAIRLEKELAALEKKQHEDRLAAFDLEAATTGKLTEEQKKKRQELRAAIIRAEAEGSSATIKFQKELEKLRDEAAKKEEERIADRRASARAESKAVDTTTKDPLIEAFETQAKIKTDIQKRLVKDVAKINKEAADEEAKRLEQGVVYTEMIEREKLGIISNFASSLSGLAEADSDERKVLASAQALINTYLAATAALASGSEINPIFGIISAATAVAAGLQSVAKINGVEFAEGGWTGPGSKYQVAGVVHADEYVAPKHVVNSPAARPHINALESMRLRPYYDGGLVTRSISSPIDQSFDVLNIVRNMPAPVVGIKQFADAEKAVKMKQNISKR
jgi:hypothetical protein